MIRFLTNLTLMIFDYFHKKKIINYLKKLNIHSINTFFDIGAHKGESIDFFSKNLEIKKIYSFEASLKNFKVLKKYKSNKFIFRKYCFKLRNSTKIFNQCNESSSLTLVKLTPNQNI